MEDVIIAKNDPQQCRLERYLYKTPLLPVSNTLRLSLRYILTGTSAPVDKHFAQGANGPKGPRTGSDMAIVARLGTVDPTYLDNGNSVWRVPHGKSNIG
jgi:hypothetical protein